MKTSDDINTNESGTGEKWSMVGITHFAVCMLTLIVGIAFVVVLFAEIYGTKLISDWLAEKLGMTLGCLIVIVSFSTPLIMHLYPAKGGGTALWPR